MYVGASDLAPRKFSPVTGRDPITGMTRDRHQIRRMSALGMLSDAPIAAPADLAKAISDEFAAYRALASASTAQQPQIQLPAGYGGGTQWVPNPAYMQAVKAALNSLPAWYGGSGVPTLGSGTTVPFSNVSQGATPATGYLSFRVLNRNGVRLWEVPATYRLNEGTQTITPAMAALAGGFPAPIGPAVRPPGGWSIAILEPRWLFPIDPHPYLPVGQIGAGYVGGVSGKSITMQAIKGVAMVVLPVVAGVVAAPLIFGAAGAAGAGAGTAAGAAAGGVASGAGTAAGAAAGGAAAGTGAAAGAATLVPAALVPAAIVPAAGAAGGILGTGVTAAQAGAILSAAKTAYGLAAQHKQNAEQAAGSGNIPLANQNAGLAVQYQQQGDSIMSTLNQPTVGGLPLWVLAAGALLAKLAFF